jgi:peptidoglycan hydrolase CwlO-like protein
MKSKLALFSIIVPCLWFLIVSALAQTSGSQNSTSSASSGGPAFGQDSFAGNPGSPFSVDNSTRDVFAEPSPIAQPAREGQTSTFFYQTPAFYGNRHNWSLHNEDAAIAPLVQRLKDAKSDTDIEKLKGQLDDALEKSFAMRQKRHTQEIEELEAKVKTLKELVAKRQEKRREIVANRREQILRDAQGLGW